MHQLFHFKGGTTGQWRVVSMSAPRGEGLVPVAHIEVNRADHGPQPEGVTWRLQGQISNVRYATRTEITSMRARPAPLARAQSRFAALIPIKKSAAWWDLAQDERRAIFEEQSHHTEIGLGYMPTIARQLYHSRDLGEPFDFLTWFEYAPEHADQFEDLVAKLRATTEWRYVEREVDIRLERLD